MLKISGPRPVAVVSFGGIGEGYGWDKRLTALDVNALCLSDDRSRWYLDGCDGLPGQEAMLEEIAAFFADHPGHARLLLGQSAGGYAALRHADRFDAAVLAFAPQTHQFWTNVGPGLAQMTMPPDVPDIRGDLLFSERNHPMHIVISRSERDNVGAAAWGDRIHVAGLDRADKAHIHVIDYDQHPVAFHLARTGQLNAFLELGLGSTAAPTASLVDASPAGLVSCPA